MENTEEKKTTIFARFIRAQARFTSISKDKQAKAFGGQGYQYADINAVMEAVRPILNAEGLAITQDVEASDGSVSVRTRVFDEEGAELTSGVFTTSTVGLQQKGVQGLGSAITYARRYSLMSFLGLAYGERDDDGADASAHAYAPRPARPQPLPPVEEQDKVTGDLMAMLVGAKDAGALDEACKAIAAAKDKLSSDRQAHLREMYRAKKKQIGG